MKPYLEDITYYYLTDGQLKGTTALEVPDEYFDDCCTASEAVRFVQQLGCQGRSQHIIHSKFHRCALAVLRMAVERYGEVFPRVLRGCSGNLPIEKHLILFGSLDRRVAEFYGEVQEFKNIRGLRVNSQAKSVLTDDYTVSDEEIIFFMGG